MKKIFAIFISLMMLLSVAFVSACNKPSGNNSGTTSSNDGTPSSGNEPTSSSKTPQSFSDSFGYSYEEPKPITKDEPTATAKADYPLYYAMYKMNEEDGSYSGTDVSRGFYQTEQRASQTFETTPQGYGEGVTGGRGAKIENIYECTTRQQIIDALTSIASKQKAEPSLKAIIKIVGTISEDTTLSDGFQVIVSNVKNISIMGVDKTSILDGLGLNFKTVDNVIVQNLTIHHPAKSKRIEKDCLEFNSCKGVWVDHCELYNDYPTNSSEKDYYDGLLDVKNDSRNITFSYNYLHDAWKTSLVGSGPDDVFATRNLTYHHNIFENCNSRVPMVRGGKAHIYNNKYINVLSRGLDSRFGAEVYVENNIYENCKNNVIGWHEEAQGYFNAVGNEFRNCKTKSVTSTCDFTPSYRYTLDKVADLDAYLAMTVGVGKIDFAVATAEPAPYEKYVIPEDKIIDRSITELGEVKLDSQTEQKLIYLSKQVLFSEKTTIEMLKNLSVLQTAIDTYFTLYAKYIDDMASNCNTTTDFITNCERAFALNKTLNELNEFVKAKITQEKLITDLYANFSENFASRFNDELNRFNSLKSTDMADIERLLKLYYQADEEAKKNADFDKLKKLYTDCQNIIAVENFTKICNELPTADKVASNHKLAVEEAQTAYKALTEHQKYLLPDAITQKYNAVISAYNTIISSQRKMDLTNVAVGRTTLDSTIAGDINIGKSTDVRAVNETFGSATYTKSVYISGYGNPGSKCLQFDIFAKSKITIVIKAEGSLKLLLTDKDKNIKNSLVVDSTNTQIITFENVEAGEYRLFTDIPDGTVLTSSKLDIFEFTITPC